MNDDFKKILLEKIFIAKSCNGKLRSISQFGNKVWREKHGYSMLWDVILENTVFLPSSASVSERLYCFLNDIKSVPVCPMCGNNTKFGSGGYREFCCNKCVMQSTDTKNKIKETCKEKYGVENPQQNKKIQIKTAKTNMKRYGNKMPINTPTKQEQIVKKYQKKYGVDHWMQLDSTKNKIKETCKEKYGVENPMRTSLVKNKIKETCKEKYGRENGNQLHISDYAWEKLHDISWLKEMYDSKRLPVYEIADQLDISQSMVKKYLRKAGFHLRITTSTSKGESDVADFIRSIYSGPIIRNSRKIIAPYELDIYLPELKLAIEYNGNYWHSSKKLPKNYHFNKFKRCQRAGILLAQIFESEWIENSKGLKKYLKCCIKNKPYNMDPVQNNFRVDPVLFRAGVCESFEPPSKILIDDTIIWSAGKTNWNSKHLGL